VGWSNSHSLDKAPRMQTRFCTWRLPAVQK
jgi:hypothetical protein